MVKRISSLFLCAFALAAHGAVPEARLSVVPEAESVLAEERFVMRVRLEVSAPLLAEQANQMVFPWLPLGEDDDKKPVATDITQQNIPTDQPRAIFYVALTSSLISRNGNVQPQRTGSVIIPETKEEADGKTWSVYLLSLDCVARKEGEYALEPMFFRGVVAGADGKPTLVNAQSAPVPVRVVAPPLENQPASFIGVTATEMTLEATLDTHSASVGDPLSLTLTVRSDALAPDSIQPPKLSRQANLNTAFRIYDESVSSESLPNGKRFTYRIRPLATGTIEFPPVEAAFFDKVTRSYQVRTSAPIPIQVQATTQITAVGGEPDAETEARPMPSGITLNPAGATETTPLMPSARFLWLAQGIPLALHAGLSLLRLSRRALRALRERRRRYGACASTLRRLTRADSAEALRLIREWLGRRLDVPPAGLTPPDIARLLAAHAAPSEALCAIIEELEARLYQAGADTSLPAETQSRLRALLPEIDAVLSQRRPSCEG